MIECSYYYYVVRTYWVIIYVKYAVVAFALMSKGRLKGICWKRESQRKIQMEMEG